MPVTYKDYKTAVEIYSDEGGCCATEILLKKTAQIIADRVEEAVKEALAGQWQDISTAPKDGKKVLLRINGRTCEGFWYKGSFNVPSRFDIKTEMLTRVYPTHWMPTPPNVNKEE